MGLFTYLNIPDSLLPEKYKGSNKWQTYDIVEPIMGTITISDDGSMKYSFDTTFIGGTGKNIFTEELECHTLVAKINTDNGEDVNGNKWELIRAKAEFKDGKLIRVF